MPEPSRVPSMAEVRATHWNGLTVASLFSGCGGSSLGYRMAGYRVLWANEFVEAARECYLANCDGTTVDARDVRELTPQDVLHGCHLGVGELDVLDGSPPCASFSTAGRREKLWGKEKAYSGKTQRTDDLFAEFVRILRGVRPRAFVAENVAGLAKGVSKGHFLRILEDLKASGYEVSAQLLDAQWLGVPQSRKRLIFVGVREDLELTPPFPAPFRRRVSLREALAGLPASELPRECMLEGTAIGREATKLRPGDQSDRYFSLVRPRWSSPSPTVTASGGGRGVAGVVHPDGDRKFTIPELKRVCGFPDDFALTGTFARQWERLGRAVPPPMMREVARALAETLLPLEVAP